MAKILLISVGGTPEPIIKSIRHHKPRYVCFFASEDSSDKLGKIKKSIKKELSKIEFKHFTTDNHEDLTSCYEAARKACNWVKNKIKSKKDKLIVDYTGGTKVMSAALVLATVDCGCKFSYVGGRKRNKGGLGVVITGSEEVREERTPWEVLKVEKRKEFALLFNKYQFRAAMEIGQSLLEQAPKGEKEVFKVWNSLAEGYYLWDIFKHNEARAKIKSALEGLRGYYKFGEKKELPDFITQIGENLSFLSMLVKGKERDNALIQDIFNNALRRIEEGKYDDATMRLYRTLEKVMQVEFRKEFGCETGQVKPECLPESIRDKYLDKYRSEREKDIILKLPLEATARALQEKNNKISKYYFENYENQLRNLIHTRNNLILAHGDGSVGKEQVEKFKDLMTNFLKKFKLYKEICFPKIQL